MPTSEPCGASMAVPDMLGEIIAFRAWHVDTSSILNGPRLYSVVAPNVEWPTDRWLEAVCPYGNTGEPVPHGNEHGCGIHAALNRRDLARLNYQSSQRYGDPSYAMAIGEVGLVGRVIPGSQGWIASRARPIRLFLPHIYWKLVKPLEAAYGIPVTVSNTLEGVEDGYR